VLAKQQIFNKSVYPEGCLANAAGSAAQQPAHTAPTTLLPRAPPGHRSRAAFQLKRGFSSSEKLTSSLFHLLYCNDPRVTSSAPLAGARRSASDDSGSFLRRLGCELPTSHPHAEPRGHTQAEDRGLTARVRTEPGKKNIVPKATARETLARLPPAEVCPQRWVRLPSPCCTQQCGNTTFLLRHRRCLLPISAGEEKEAGRSTDCFTEKVRDETCHERLTPVLTPGTRPARWP